MGLMDATAYDAWYDTHRLGAIPALLSAQPLNGSGVVNGMPFFRTARTARQSGIT